MVRDYQRSLVKKPLGLLTNPGILKMQNTPVWIKAHITIAAIIIGIILIFYILKWVINAIF